MKNLTQISKDNSVKYNQLRKQLIMLNILQESKVTIPTFEALELNIATPIIFNKNGLSKTYFHFDEELINNYLDTGEVLKINEELYDTPTAFDGDNLPF